MANKNLPDKNFLKFSSELEQSITKLIGDISSNDRDITWYLHDENNKLTLNAIYNKEREYLTTYTSVLEQLQSEGRYKNMPDINRLIEISKFQYVDDMLYFKYKLSQPGLLFAYCIWMNIHH